MAIDPFASTVDSPTAPASYCFAVVPHDLNDVPRVTKALYVGQGGDIALRSVDGDSDVNFVDVPAGMVLDVRVIAVRATGTTAGNIVGLA